MYKEVQRRTRHVQYVQACVVGVVSQGRLWVVIGYKVSYGRMASDPFPIVYVLMPRFRRRPLAVRCLRASGCVYLAAVQNMLHSLYWLSTWAGNLFWCVLREEALRI